METLLNEPSWGGAGFAFIVIRIRSPKHVDGAVHERSLWGESCRRARLGRSFRKLMMSRPRATFSSAIDNAEVMLRMLRVIFRGYSIPSRLGFAG